MSRRTDGARASHARRPKGQSDVELSLSFVDEAEMADLHDRYMDEAGPTDVLTFPLDEDDGPRTACACWATW